MIESLDLTLLTCSLIDAALIITIMKILLNISYLSRTCFILSTLILGICISLNYIIPNSFIRLSYLFFNIVLCSYLSSIDSKVDLQKIIIYSFLEFICLILSNLFVYTIFSQVINNNIIINMIILFIFTLFMYIYILRKDSINKSIFKNKFLIIYILSLVVIFVILYHLFDTDNKVYIFIFNFIVIGIYSFITFKLFREKRETNKIKLECKTLSTNLTEYENLLDAQRVSNHENKNQLLVIKGMLSKSEEHIREYIDSIIDSQYADNDLLILKTNIIPLSGLRNLIYYKMLTMKEKKIETELDVDKTLRSLNFANIPVKVHQELCKIVGVFLDNAIQEVEKIENKKIMISLNYLDEKLVITISNTYSGYINLEKLDEVGYTTKGKGHGYGLSLVKQIVEESNNFVHEKNINGNIFSQIIKLKV